MKSIRSSLLNTQLRTKVYLSFMTVALLLVVACAVGIYGNFKIYDYFETHIQYSENVGEYLELGKSSIELQRRVMKYSESGREADKQRVLAYHDQLWKTLEEVRTQSSNKLNEDALSRMSTHLQNYKKGFIELSEEREIRDRLLKVDIPETSDQILEALRRYESLAIKSSLPRTSLHTVNAKASLAAIKTNILKFAAEPEAQSVRTIRQNLELLRKQLNEAEVELGLEENSVTVPLVKSYDKLIFRFIQATRTYLFAQQVVMAGDAYEFMYLTRELEKEYSSLLQGLTDQAFKSAISWRNFTSILALAALFVGATLTFLLGSAVSKPLSTLTNTFRTLSHGEGVTRIPFTEYTNEIGEMARAAEVFRKKNDETQKLANELSQNTRELKLINAELDSFAYVASHDLKAPLLGIKKIATWVVEDIGEDIPEKSVEHLDKMKERISRMESLLDGLLNYSRIGRMEQEVEEVDTDILVHDIVDMISDESSHMTFTINQKLPQVVCAKAPLRQVFLNIMANAVKYNDKEQGELVISSKVAGDFVEFVLEDNGMGIDPAYQKDIFTMFKRCYTGNDIDGTGIGLALVKKEVEHRGGEIEVTSVPGEGATFVFTWPLNEKPHSVEQELEETRV